MKRRKDWCSINVDGKISNFAVCLNLPLIAIAGYIGARTACFRQSSTRYVGPRNDVRGWSNPVVYVHSPISSYPKGRSEREREREGEREPYTRNARGIKLAICTYIGSKREGDRDWESQRDAEAANERAVRQIEGEDSSSSALLLLRDVVHADSSLAILLPRLFATLFRIFPTAWPSGQTSTSISNRTCVQVYAFPLLRNWFSNKRMSKVMAVIEVKNVQACKYFPLYSNARIMIYVES